MSHWILYHNPRCSKSREALALLKEKNINPTVIEYLKTPLNKVELKTLISQLGEDYSSIVRTKEDLYKSNTFDVTSIDQIVDHLSKEPILLERPIVVKDDTAVVGRPTERITDTFF